MKKISVSCLPDSGTTKSIVSLDIVKRNKLTLRRASNIVLTDASDNMMAVEGTVCLSV